MDTKYRVGRQGGWKIVAETDDRDEAIQEYDATVAEFPTDYVVLFARRDGRNSGAQYYEWRHTDEGWRRVG